ncbi:MAG: hypothetical protein PUK79_01830, partial [Clostridiales bacterium]|nr:hypothetical protein [Clostridiales bacterium]
MQIADFAGVAFGASENRQPLCGITEKPLRQSGPFPVRRTKKRKTLLKNKTILSGHAPKFKRGKTVFERDTLKIVEMDVLG